jgi:type IV secretory pathway TraG/TraD family ATPase VirD4
MFGTFTGPVAFIGTAVLMMIAVPRTCIQRYVWMGIVGGLFLAVLLLAIMQNVLSFWIFTDIDLLYFYNIPMSLAAVWLPLVIMFSYFVNAGNSNLTRSAALIGSFALLAAIAHWFLLTEGLLVYRNWSLVYTFILAGAIHAMLYAYLQLANQAKNLW